MTDTIIKHKGSSMQAVIASKRTKNLDFNFELVTITPDLATNWLAANTHNRKLRRSTVASMARDISQGHWRVTGDAIKFAPDGTLLDGQHRLAACVAANLPITSLVVYGVHPDCQNVIDCGRPRSAIDVLALNGQTNTSALATACRFIINEKRGVSPVGGIATVTTAQTMAVIKRHPKLPLYLSAPRAFPRGISVGLVGYVRYVASTFLPHALDADAMVTVLKTGVPSYDGDAVHRYREKIISSYTEAVGGYHSRVAAINTFKWCWNRFVEKKPVASLRWVNTDVAIDGLNLDDL